MWIKLIKKKQNSNGEFNGLNYIKRLQWETWSDTPIIFFDIFGASNCAFHRRTLTYWTHHCHHWCLHGCLHCCSSHSYGLRSMMIRVSFRICIYIRRSAPRRPKIVLKVALHYLKITGDNKTNLYMKAIKPIAVRPIWYLPSPASHFWRFLGDSGMRLQALRFRRRLRAANFLLWFPVNVFVQIGQNLVNLCQQLSKGSIRLRARNALPYHSS